jgi:hypothetical protein
VLTEAQVSALELKKDDDIACGELKTAHPGYLGAQDTFYVGTLKGVGRIYQQTFIDCYSKVACAKLYTTKTALTAADMLNDKVLPFFEEQDLPLLRALTDRETEYCSFLQEHDYQLYLAVNDIEHTKTHSALPKPMVFVSVFTKLSYKSFIKLLFARRYMKISRKFKRIEINGLSTTIMNGLTKVKDAADELLCKRYMKTGILGRKNV